MEIKKIIKKIRIAIADNVEPYVYEDNELITVMEVASGVYSKYRPAKRKGTLLTKPQQREYSLPDDFQTWITGLDDYEVYDKTLDVGFIPIFEFEIAYTYYGNRTAEEIPFSDVFLLVDYCFHFIVDGAIKETSDISALKLGKGLQIQFSNIDELNKAAERRLKNFYEKLQTCSGGWA